MLIRKLFSCLCARMDDPARSERIRTVICRRSTQANCTVGDGCVVRFNAVVDGCHLPAGFHVPSTLRIGRSTDPATLPKVSVDASEFSGDVARTNNELVLGYKQIQNEF